jgi:tRNA uridine 5-carboxymethylaminomethyl modification enzyme
VRLTELARRPGVTLVSLLDAVGLGFDGPREVALSVELELKYAGYFERERVHAEKLRRMSHLLLPLDLPYELFRSLSTEARQKLAARRPSSLAQAASIPGVSPSDLQNLLIELERHRRMGADSPQPAS